MILCHTYVTILWYVLIHKIQDVCVSLGDCSFEQGTCSWSNVKGAFKANTLDNFDWIMGSGSTPSIFTGPSVDHTTGTKSGKWIRLDIFDFVRQTCRD